MGSVLILQTNFGKMKRKPKPPKFYVSMAVKDINNTDIYVGYDWIYDAAVLRLKMLSEAISLNQLAPLPKELEGSLYDPKMLDLRSDEEFNRIYEDDLKNTAEEHITFLMYLILLYDKLNHAKCHVQKPHNHEVFDYSVGSAIENIETYAMELHHVCEDYKYQFNLPKMLSMLYPYIVEFAEKLYLDLNVFLKWYLRYRSL